MEGSASVNPPSQRHLHCPEAWQSGILLLEEVFAVRVFTVQIWLTRCLYCEQMLSETGKEEVQICGVSCWFPAAALSPIQTRLDLNL